MAVVLKDKKTGYRVLIDKPGEVDRS